jgi:hypothetical protein
MDINIYIACLRQLVAFAPKVIIGNNYRRYGRMGGQRERARGGGVARFKLIRLTAN